MAWYQYPQLLKQSTAEAYDQFHNPGVAAPFAGIYRCAGCGREIGIAYNHTLPPQNHHEHTASQGTIRWQLIVCADHRQGSEQT
jgi:hypothetical protein